jgi:hypothetical protein
MERQAKYMGNILNKIYPGNLYVKVHLVNFGEGGGIILKFIVKK